MGTRSHWIGWWGIALWLELETELEQGPAMEPGKASEGKLERKAEPELAMGLEMELEKELEPEMAPETELEMGSRGKLERKAEPELEMGPEKETGLGLAGMCKRAALGPE